MTARYIALHALQSFPASLPNRSDDNAPKTIRMGGVQRLRISSQAWKRAMRSHLRQQSVEGGAFAVRTVYLPREVRTLVTDMYRRDAAEAEQVVDKVFRGLGLRTNGRGCTKVMVFCHEYAAGRIASLVDAAWDSLTDEGSVSEGLVSAVRAVLDPGNAIDIALHGRMLAELDGANVVGALQVADAFGVEAAVIEEDFFVAVDDLARTGDPASGMLGTTVRTAGVYYRYAVLDRRQLRENLTLPGQEPDEREALAVRSELAMIRSFALTVPPARGGATAPHTLPAVVLSVESARPVSHADAYTRVLRLQRSDPDRDPLTQSVERLMAAHTRTAALLPVQRAAMLYLADEETIGKVPDGVVHAPDLDALSSLGG